MLVEIHQMFWDCTSISFLFCFKDFFCMFVCVYVWVFACLSLHAQVCALPWRSKGVRYSGTGVIGSYEPPDENTGKLSYILCKISLDYWDIYPASSWFLILGFSLECALCEYVTECSKTGIPQRWPWFWLPNHVFCPMAVASISAVWN